MAAILLALSAAADAEPYDRSLYKHWIDANHDCQGTRTEVLIAESLITITLDGRGCVVSTGKWVDPYTGKTFTTRASSSRPSGAAEGGFHRRGSDSGRRSALRTAPTISPTTTR